MTAIETTLLSIATVVLSLFLLSAQFGYAVHHDCSVYPYLKSTFFGKQVPINTICKIAGY